LQVHSRRRRFKLDATYSTSDHAHAMIGAACFYASWDGDRLTLWTSNQMIDWGVDDVAKTLRIPKEKVRLSRRFIGRRFRRQTVRTRRRDPGRPRGPRRGPSVKVALQPAADFQQYDAPSRDDPADSDRRRQRRQDRGDRARKLVRQSGGRQSGNGGAADPACSMPAPTG